MPEKTVDREKAQALLVEAQLNQTEFWRALTALEEEIGCDVDGTQDLEGMDIDTLIELGVPEDDDEIDGPEDCAVPLCFQPADEGSTLCIAHKDTYCAHGCPLDVECDRCEAENGNGGEQRDEAAKAKSLRRAFARVPNAARREECPECGSESCASWLRTGKPCQIKN